MSLCIARFQDNNCLISWQVYYWRQRGKTGSQSLQFGESSFRCYLCMHTYVRTYETRANERSGLYVCMIAPPAELALVLRVRVRLTS